ncbi:MAG: hypothetical protein ACRCX2_06555 [Paraclostridium sp.]
MSQQIATYDESGMRPGTFYELRVNKDLATAVIEAPPSPIHFTEIKYLKEQLTTSHSIEIWEKRIYNGSEIHRNITHAVDWYLEQPGNYIIILSNLPITGYIKFI